MMRVATTRLLRAAALGYGVAALPYLALLGDSMWLFFLAALVAPLGWAFVFRSAWVVSGRARRVLWLLGPAGLLSLLPGLATAALYLYWSQAGFGS